MVLAAPISPNKKPQIGRPQFFYLEAPKRFSSCHDYAGMICFSLEFAGPAASVIDALTV